jgi:hypothetical protein
MSDSIQNSKTLDRVDWVRAIENVLAQHPEVDIPKPVIDSLATAMRENCQYIFRSTMSGVKRSIERHIATNDRSL